MKIISPKTKQDFDKYYELRWRVLRKPWQQAKGTEQDKDEKIAYHLMAIENNVILAVARLQNISSTEAQLRYMAVDKQHENLGLGRAIVLSMEQYARKNNILSIMLHARENAVGFYKKTGYIVVEKSYLLFDCIQHYKMKKDL
jgi:predicted GNAT family N-acyltransferase